MTECKQSMSGFSSPTGLTGTFKSLGRKIILRAFLVIDNHNHYLLGGAVTLKYVLSFKTCNRVFESRCGTFFFFFPEFYAFYQF